MSAHGRNYGLSIKTFWPSLETNSVKLKRLFMTLVFMLAMVQGMQAGGIVGSDEFARPELAQRFANLTKILRCPKCQNQNLADSDSIIATDLRLQVKNMLDQGLSDDQIREFMVQRYGDFILYDPPFKSQTLFLWLSPGVLLVLGLWLVMRLRPQSLPQQDSAQVATLSDAEKAELQALMEVHKRGSESGSEFGTELKYEASQKQATDAKQSKPS